MTEETEEVQEPMTNDTYCFTHYTGEAFHTILVSYLVPFFVSNHNIQLITEVGELTFVTQSDQPMYLIPFDAPMAVQFGMEVQTAHMDEEGDGFELKIPMLFPGNLMPFMHYKIDDQKLFKQEDNQWTQINLPS
jgi:hypothetical protein